jgi:hypothetical protein
MKTKNLLRKLVFAGSFLLALTIATSSKAQIGLPYQIYNNLNCDVNYDFNFYDSNCTWICSSVNITVPAGGSITLPACPGTFDIGITVNWIGAPSCPATQSNPLNVFCPPGSSPATITLPAGCNCASSTITADSNQSIIQ